MYLRPIFTAIAALMLILGAEAQSSWAVQEFSQKQALEQAVGPKAFLSLEGEGKLTVRALRAWNRLPPEFMDLASSLRREKGLDLLGADLETIQAWIEKAEQGKQGLSSHFQALQALSAYMQSGNYLDWEEVADLEHVPEGTFLRQGAKRWEHTKKSQPSGTQTSAVSEAEMTSTAILDGPESEVETASQAEELGSKPGLEYRISDQVQGTFRASLGLEGLEETRIEDDHYFQVMAGQALPESPAVQALEQKELTPNALNWKSDAPYQVRAGYAQLGQQVAVRVEVLDKPGIVLTDKEAEAGISYEIVGRKFKVIVSDQARGDAEIDFEKDWNGEDGGGAAWIPLVDQETGRPVGPRAIGVYMAYRVKKFGPHKSFIGELSHDFRRIGWVLIAMPGDLYADADNIYAVGSKEPLAGKDAQSNWEWPAAAAESLDFTLPQKAVDRAAARFSLDMQHVAWIEEDPKKGQRVVLNGRPGRWYDDIFRYMKFSEHGELFGFRADLGEWEIPVIDGADGPVFENIRRFEITRDGAHYIVAGRVRKGLEKVVVNGQGVRETTAEIKEAVLAPDGSAAWVEESADNGLVRMISTKKGEGNHPEYKTIYSPQFAGHENVLAYIGVKENKQRFLVLNGRELQPTMGVGYKYTLTPDGRHYAYVTPPADNTESMVIDGQSGPAYRDISNPALLSSDGSYHVYAAESEAGEVLVVNGQEFGHEYGRVEKIVGLTLSPDEKGWAASFELGDKKDREYVVLVSGREVVRRPGTARQIAFSPDGSRVAWLEKKDTSWRVVVDGQESALYHDINTHEPPQFSPDGRHVVYFTQDKDKRMSIAVFGGGQRTHDLVFPLARFTEKGIAYMAIDGTRMQRFTMGRR